MARRPTSQGKTAPKLTQDVSEGGLPYPGNDFDFLTGTWDVANRWRTDFLDPTSAWEEFPNPPTLSGVNEPEAAKLSTASATR